MCERKQPKKRKATYTISLFVIFAMLFSVLGVTLFTTENANAADSYEPDNTPSEATSIPVDGTLQSHDFDPAGDEDWLNFSATNAMMYTIETHNLVDADTKIYLIDTDGVSVLDYDDDDGEGLASKIVWIAPRDDYFYVRIEELGGNGGPTYTYDVNITEEVAPPMDAYEPDDNPQNATLTLADGSIQNHNFHISGNLDWLNFTAVNNTVYLIETHNLTDANTGLVLFGSDTITLYGADDDNGVGLASKIIWKAPKDDYFYVVVVEVNSNAGVNYTYDINISETVEPPGDIYEPDDSSLNASAIATDGSIQNHSFHIAGDEDWLAFSATSGTMYAIETFNLSGTDTYVYLFDSDGTTILDYDDNSGAGLGSYIFWTAPSDDTYYVKIMDSYGFAGPNCTYEINITETQPPTGDIYEPDDNPAEAAQIPTDGSLQSHDFHVNGDEDWLNFTAVQGTMYIIETHNLGSADTYIYLYDSDGITELEYDDDGSSEPLASKIVWTCPRSDYYFVMIEELDGDFGPGYTYDVNVSISGYPGGDAFEPDNSYNDANAISQDGTMQSHNFHFLGDVDWIRIITSTGWTYTIETHNLGDADTEIFLFADDGTTQLGFDDDGGVDGASKIVWTAPGNDIIYVRVEEASNFYGSTYTYDINVIETQYLPEPPGAPENLTAIAGDSYVNLSWDPPASNGSSPISNYTIYRNTTSGLKEIYIEIGNQTYYNDSNVTNFVTYYYNISAKNADGEGIKSNEVNATPFLLPTAPISITAAPGDSYVYLTWDAPASDGGSPVVNYTIYRKTLLGAKNIIATIGNVTYYNDTDVSEGITYYYSVGASNFCGEGTLSEEVSAKLITAPTSPTNLEITYGDSFVKLTWEAPASTGGAPITNYMIYKGTDSGEESFLVEIQNVTTYNDTSVINGVMYYYQVSAKNSVGEGVLSWEESGKPATVPDAPTNITAKGSTSTLLGISVITISWTPPASDGGAQITNYKIYRGTKPGEETFLADAGSLSVYIDSDIKSGVKYYYKVVAENEMGEGVSSAEASVIPKEISAAPVLLFLGIIMVIIIVVVVLVVLLILKRKGKKAEVEPQIGFEGTAWDQVSPAEQMQPVAPMGPSSGPLPPTPQTPGQYPPPPPVPGQKPIQPPKPSVITYRCPHCQKNFTAESPTQALVVACPSCGGHTTIGPS